MVRRGVVLFLLIIAFRGYGDTADGAGIPAPDTEAAVPTGRIVLRSIQLVITGKTSDAAVLREIRVEEGQVFSDRETFEFELRRDVQELINLRVFSRLEYQIDYSGSTGSAVTEAVVTITAVDTWSIFPFIVPMSDGSGSALRLAVVDKNFLGTLTELSLTGGMVVGRDPVDRDYEVSDWDLRLQWAGVTVNRWQFSSRVSFGYVTQRKLDGSEVVEDLSFHEFLWATDIRYEAAFLRNLYIHILPVIGSRFHYDVRSAGDPVEYEYMRGGLGLGAEFNRVDWVGFLRRGWNAGLLNYYWMARDGGFVQKNTITGRVSLHFLAGRDHAVNPSFRLLGFYSFAHEAPSLGRYVRGVDADVMFGDRALILNTGLQFRIFGRDRIEVHLQPFVDMGLAVPEDTSVDWSRDFHAGVGSEMLLFFPTLPGLQIRGYAGVDLMVDDWSAPTKWNLGLSFDLLY